MNVDIAVSGMAVGDHGDIVFLTDLLDLDDKFGDAAPRDDRVGDVQHTVVLQSRIKFFPSFHQIALGFLGVGQEDIDRPLLEADFSDLLSGFHELFLAGGLKEEQQIGRVARHGHFKTGIALHQLENILLHKLDAHRQDFFLENGRHAADGVVQLIEWDEEQVAAAGRGNQPERDFGNDGQGAFRSRNQLSQIVGGGRFKVFAAGLDDFAIGQNGFQTQNEVAGDSIFDSAHAAGIGSDVAPDAG